MNIDKGNQASDGQDAVNIGTIGNSVNCGQGEPQWELKRLVSDKTIEVTTGAETVRRRFATSITLVNR